MCGSKLHAQLKRTGLQFILIIALCFRLIDVHSQPTQPAPMPTAIIDDQVKSATPKPIPPSPNVASLGKYLDYPVSFFTGLPDISIPIFEAKSGNLSVPISLSYHASGVRPTDVASWVGMGWSLSAGGQIARSVHGKPDEEYYYNTQLLDHAPTLCTDYTILDGLTSASPSIDADPDIYSYSFPGKSGKFIFLPPVGGVHPPPLTFPYEPFIIRKVGEGSDKYEIIDENGVLYRFGRNAQNIYATEGTNATNGGNPSVVATTAWHLLDIEAPNSSDKINLSYQTNDVMYTKDISHTFTVIDKCTGYGCPSTDATVAVKNIESTITQLALSTILFETGKVEFILGSVRNDQIQSMSGSGAKNLSEIRISTKTNTGYVLKKTVRFVYSYFKDNNGNDEALKLDEVQMLDASSSIVQRYRFNYTTNKFSWNRDNSNFLNARDLWGFYNGALSNSNLLLPTTVLTELIGETSSFTFGGGLNRAVNEELTKEGVLNRIDFPTGGYTEFEYESNKYEDVTIKVAGGLRVKRIESLEKPGSVPIVKVYKYGEGESGYGDGNFNFQQINSKTSQQTTVHCDVYQLFGRYSSQTFASMSSFSQDGFESPVRYEVVTEYLGDPDDTTSTINGRTVYEYDNKASLPDQDQFVPNTSKSFHSTNAWRRGNLTAKRIYNATGQLLSETLIHYDVLNESNPMVGYGAGRYIGNSGTCNSYCTVNGVMIDLATFNSTLYTQPTGALRQDMVTEKIYEIGSVSKVITNTSRKIFDEVKLVPLSETLTRSANNTQEDAEKVTVYLYPFHLSANNLSTGNAKGIYLLNTKNVLTTPVEKHVMIQDGYGTNQRVVASQVTTFRQNGTTQYVVPDKMYFLETSTAIPITNYSFVSINGSNNGLTMNSGMKPRIEFISYDTDGKLLTWAKLATDQAKELNSFKYGYDNSLPVAECLSADNTEVQVKNFEDESTSTTIVNNPAAAHSGEQYFFGDYVTDFAPTSTIPGRTYVLDYWYFDNDNKWKFIKKNYTGSGMLLNEGTAIDDVRIYPVGSLIKSFTYDKLYGKTSESDINGIITFFEYDQFGRLSIIRDSNRNILKTYEYKYAVTFKME